MQQVLLDGWLLRFSKGFTKRANSIVPLYPSLSGDRAALEEKLRYCENLYAREKLQTIFRLTSVAGESKELAQLQALLDDHDYAVTEKSLVLTRDLPRLSSTSGGELQLLPLADWVAVYTQLTDIPQPAAALHQAILQGIQGPCAFAALKEGSSWVACGLAVSEQEQVGMFDIVAAPSQRRRGHARRLVQGLLEWGSKGGARQAYLQMVADNEPAGALYTGLGFKFLYSYQYRVSG